MDQINDLKLTDILDFPFERLIFGQFSGQFYCYEKIHITE